MTTTWTLPIDLLRISLEVMRPHGVRGDEGLALWFGRANRDRVDISHLVEPFGPGLVTGPYRLSLSLRGMAKLTDLAEQLGAPLVGQIHSHPGGFVDLSKVDRVEGIRVPGYLSLVCPAYAQIPDLTLDQCGVHAFENSAYRRLGRYEVSQRLSTADRKTIYLRCELPK